MKAIIFDMDGLMIDSERLYFEAEREIAQKFDKAVKEETLWEMMGRKPIESVGILVRDLDIPASPQEILKTRNILMRQKLADDLLPMPGLHHLIRSFYGQLKLAVCTGAEKEFLDIALDKLGIRDKFAVLQPSNGIINGKPDPEIYLETCRKLGLPPKDCIVLEDSANGALAGKRAGCYVIAVPTEYTRGQEFGFVDFMVPDLFGAAGHIRTLTGTPMAD